MLHNNRFLPLFSFANILLTCNLQSANHNPPKSNLKIYALGAASIGAIGYLGYKYFAQSDEDKYDREAYKKLRKILARKGSIDALFENPNYRVFESPLDEMTISKHISRNISFEEFKRRNLQEVGMSGEDDERDARASFIANMFPPVRRS